MDFEQFNPSEDNQSDAEKIEKYTGDVDWSYLQPHFDAGSLVCLSVELSLTEVALAFSEDDKTKVQAWLETGVLFQPTQEDAAKWKAQNSRFNVTIVRPFILIQLMAE